MHKVQTVVMFSLHKAKILRKRDAYLFIVRLSDGDFKRLNIYLVYK